MLCVKALRAKRQEPGKQVLWIYLFFPSATGVYLCLEGSCHLFRFLSLFTMNCTETYGSLWERGGYKRGKINELGGVPEVASCLDSKKEGVRSHMTSYVSFV